MKLYKKLTDNFTVISNEIFKHNLSAKAIGLYCYVINKPDGWEFSREGIMAHLSDGQASIQSGLRELEKTGFLIRDRKRQGDGTLGKADWFISDKPMVEKPMVENPTLDKPTVDKVRQVNTNRSKDYKKVNTKRYTSFSDLTPEVLQELSTTHSVSVSDLVTLRNRMGGWLEANGKSYKNYRAALVNWLVRTIDEGKIKTFSKVSRGSITRLVEEAQKEDYGNLI